MSQPLADRPLTRPHPDRLAEEHPRRAEILAAHEAALAGGQAGYLDPETGLFVLTAGFLAARGTCCGRGCRHCPYAGAVTITEGAPASSDIGDGRYPPTRKQER